MNLIWDNDVIGYSMMKCHGEVDKTIYKNWTWNSRIKLNFFASPLILDNKLCSFYRKEFMWKQTKPKQSKMRDRGVIKLLRGSNWSDKEARPCSYCQRLEHNFPVKFSPFVHRYKIS